VAESLGQRKGEFSTGGRPLRDSIVSGLGRVSFKEMFYIVFGRVQCLGRATSRRCACGQATEPCMAGL
jgi:hypothetical protein